MLCVFRCIGVPPSRSTLADVTEEPQRDFAFVRLRESQLQRSRGVVLAREVESTQRTFEAGRSCRPASSHQYCRAATARQTPAHCFRFEAGTARPQQQGEEEFGADDQCDGASWLLARRWRQPHDRVHCTSMLNTTCRRTSTHYRFF